MNKRTEYEPSQLGSNRERVAAAKKSNAQYSPVQPEIAQQPIDILLPLLHDYDTSIPRIRPEFIAEFSPYKSRTSIDRGSMEEDRDIAAEFRKLLS